MKKEERQAGRLKAVAVARRGNPRSKAGGNSIPLAPQTYPNKTTGCRECGVYLYPQEREIGYCDMHEGILNKITAKYQGWAAPQDNQTIIRAQPYCLTHREIHTKGGANSGSIRAEEACLWCYSESDVLRERAELDKQIQKLADEWRSINKENVTKADGWKLRAGAAEQESVRLSNHVDEYIAKLTAAETYSRKLEKEVNACIIAHDTAEKKLAELDKKIRKWYGVCSQFPHKMPVSSCDLCNIVCMEMYEVLFDAPKL